MKIQLKTRILAYTYQKVNVFLMQNLYEQNPKARCQGA
jgi:hypothetical protein